MKKNLFLLLLLSFVSGKALAGNDYRPMVVEGKTWHEISRAPQAFYDFTYYVSGDTVVDENDYKKLYIKVTVSRYSEEEGKQEEIYSSDAAVWACLQECDSCVYILKHGERSMLYDFRLSIGDVAFDTDHLTLTVTKVDTISVNGINRKRLWMKEAYKDHDTGERTGYWVEGIGSNFGLEASHEWDATSMPMLYECLENSELVFSASDFSVPAWSGFETSLSDKSMQQVTTAATYDLQGRRVTGQPPRKGLYIKNGKKVVIK